MNHRRIVTLALAFVLTLLAVAPVSAAPKTAKTYCKGADFTIVDEATKLSETVSLHWSNVVTSAGESFNNQRKCMAYIQHGGTLYFDPCPLLDSDGALHAAYCLTESWLLTTAGQ